MTNSASNPAWPDHKPTALLVLADGTVFEGFGLGAEGHAVGEVCFNTAMTGYEEILTDPSYAGQLITFTFPHIGNVGTNDEDIETVNMAATPGARGVILRSAITDPSNYRSSRHLDAWLKARGIIGLSGIDTRALTRRIRLAGAPNGVIAHSAEGKFDIPLLLEMARAWPGLEGMDLAIKLADVAGFSKRKAESKKRGLLRGIGMSNTIERAAAASFEGAEIRFDRGGTASIFSGSINQGQGHQTTFTQIVADQLGVHPNDIEYIQGDTDKVFFGEGTGGSRSATMSGAAFHNAGVKVVAKAKAIAPDVAARIGSTPTFTTSSRL